MNIFEFNVKTKDNPEGYSTLSSNSVELSLMNIQNSKANILKGNYFTTLWNRHNFELTKIPILAHFEDLALCLFSKCNNFLRACIIVAKNLTIFDPTR